MPARNRKGLSEATRQRIKTSMIANRLTDHILGKCEMTATQVSAALGLLRKTLPDLQAMQLQEEVTHTEAKELTDNELANIASTGSAGASKQESSAAKPDSIH